MRVNEIFPSKYLKADDLQGRRVPVVIERVAMETMDDENKAVVHFVGAAKGLVLNRTNAGLIAAILGTDETDAWVGGRVQLYTTPVIFQGRTTMSIRVETAPAASAVPTVPQRRPVAVAPPPSPFGGYDPGPFPADTPATPAAVPGGTAFSFGANADPDSPF